MADLVQSILFASFTSATIVAVGIIYYGGIPKDVLFHCVLIVKHKVSNCFGLTTDNNPATPEVRTIRPPSQPNIPLYKESC